MFAVARTVTLINTKVLHQAVLMCILAAAIVITVRTVTHVVVEVCDQVAYPCDDSVVALAALWCLFTLETSHVDNNKCCRAAYSAHRPHFVLETRRARDVCHLNIQYP